MLLKLHYHDITVAFPWPYHDLTMTVPWPYHEVPWPYHDLTMTLPWLYNDLTMTLPWPCQNDLTMRVPMTSFWPFQCPVTSVPKFMNIMICHKNFQKSWLTNLLTFAIHTSICNVYLTMYTFHISVWKKIITVMVKFLLKNTLTLSILIIHGTICN